MLPKSRRLTRQQFWLVSQGGQSAHGSRFTVKYLPNGVGSSRWAVVTSTKLDKRAVVRNRLRRKIYNALGFGAWNLGFDIIIFPRLAMLNLSDAEIGANLNQVVSKIPRLA